MQDTGKEYETRVDKTINTHHRSLNMDKVPFK